MKHFAASGGVGVWQTFLVMELVAGTDLVTYVRGDGRALPTTLRSEADGYADTVPVAIRYPPASKRVPRLAMNQYVGTVKMLPDSRTPRRLARVTAITATTQIATRQGNRIGRADVMAATPEAVLTATVKTSAGAAATS